MNTRTAKNGTFEVEHHRQDERRDHWKITNRYTREETFTASTRTSELTARDILAEATDHHNKQLNERNQRNATNARKLRHIRQHIDNAILELQSLLETTPPTNRDDARVSLNAEHALEHAHNTLKDIDLAQMVTSLSTKTNTDEIAANNYRVGQVVRMAHDVKIQYATGDDDQQLTKNELVTITDIYDNLIEVTNHYTITNAILTPYDITNDASN